MRHVYAPSTDGYGVFRPEASDEERQEIQRRLSELLTQEDDVVLAYLHGSFLETMYRDIDIAVLLDPSPDATDRTRRALRLSEHLTRALDAGVEVDVRPLEEAPLPFRFEVLRKGRELTTKDEGRRVAFEAGTIQAFHDFQHRLAAYRREVLGARA